MGSIVKAMRKAERERGTAAGCAEEPPIEILSDVPVPAPPGPETLGVGADEPREPVALREGLDEALLAYYDRSSVISEQYRTLRTRLLSHNPRNDHRVIALTSALPGEGKSITTANLSFIFAEIRHFNVLVVDGDFRRSTMAKLLQLRPSPGLAECLTGRARLADVVQPTGIPNLHFLPAGDTSAGNATELLTSEQALRTFRSFFDRYHYTLVDTPPATTVADVGIVGQMCSGVIMLVRLDRTPEPLAKRAVRLLQVNNIPILGCMLLGGGHRSGEYGLGYGRYYRNYRHYYDYVRDYVGHRD